ncbi:PAXNEB-domain-containing protein [Dichomitus squalens LYAD-421 SS1]|uniref:PAXNEB-domain-containing protein n=1 Tax=Dichomitus squalens (strain LYAD-421) TaxID=732165 RepID=UPI0004415CCD|nr:PAXNEB-domain-containing protein [Dichomitus squalens LYAD-421 SS1]EJF67008.1 PAXNEB-domain-containing protein [Dichomitus squalens LYAD-421 SS1]
MALHSATLAHFHYEVSPATSAMSAFKRRTTSKQPPPPIGTRPSPGSPATTITSTGIPSLDDILGGGLPLSCSLLVLAPDAHSAYGELVLKYFASQGLACGQRICVVDARPDAFLSECMWMPGSSGAASAQSNSPTPAPPTAAEDEEDEKASEHDTKIKIAWRYEQMKQFQTTVQSPDQSADDYCRRFDLTSRVPESTINSALSEGRYLDVRPDESSFSEDESSCRRVLRCVAEILAKAESDSPSASALATHAIVTRICIPALGSYEWGDLSPQDVCYFLHSLRALLRRHPRACAAMSVSPHLCQETYGGPGWVQKLGWLTDASITLAAFTANPSLSAMFSSHHGLVHIHSLPAPHTLLPPSDKFSTLRGLTSSGENNLAFKCMRKRLIFETLHLDVEGGVSERRTTPSSSAFAMEAGTGHDHDHLHQPSTIPLPGGASVAAVQVQLEQVHMAPSVPESQPDLPPAKPESAFKKAKVKKKVAFTSERPDLYDF